MKIELKATNDIIPLLLKAEAPEGVIVNVPPVHRNRSSDMMQWAPSLDPLISFSIEIGKGVAIALIVQWLNNPKWKDKLQIKKDGKSVEISDSKLYDMFKMKEEELE